MSLLIAGATFTLAGCSSTEITSAQSTQIEPERVLSQTYSTSSEGAQRIEIVRDGGLVGSGVRIIVSVDGEDVAIMKSGENVVVYLPPGRHLVTASPKSFGQRGGATPTMVIVPGKTNELRVGSTSNGFFIVSR